MRLVNTTSSLYVFILILLALLGAHGIHATPARLRGNEFAQRNKLESSSASSNVSTFTVDGHHCGIPQCSYINLDRRSDRRKDLEAQMHKAQLSCTRLSAVDARAAGISAVKACRTSHIHALERLLASSAHYGLVVEDDAAWHQDQELVQSYLCNIAAHIEEHPVILLSCNPAGKGWGCPTKHSWLRRVASCQSTTAYIVRRDYAHVLLDLWRNQAPEKDIDQTWKPLQKRDRWAMTWPLLLEQSASFSDLQGAYKDYGIPEDSWQGASYCDNVDDGDEEPSWSSEATNSSAQSNAYLQLLGVF